MKYAFIQSQSGIYAVTRLCQVLDVCRSAYYDWLGQVILPVIDGHLIKQLVLPQMLLD